MGDLDGDGFDDVVVGDPGASPGGLAGAGQATVYSGWTALPLFAFNGATSGGGLGNSVAAAGDVNADGVPDVLVGAASLGGSSPTYAQVFSGASGGILLTMSPGHIVAGAGDVNGDGVDDVIVGTPGASPAGLPSGGEARIFSGMTGVVIHVFQGTASYQALGVSVGGVGDVNGDGKSDVIVGTAPPYPSPSYAKVFSGADGSAVYTMNSPAGPNNDGFGQSVAGVGDVNADGTPDFAIGAPQQFGYSPSMAGYAKVFSGTNGTSLFTLTGASTSANGSALGISLAAAGDVNGDGFAEVIVGAYGHNYATVASYTWIPPGFVSFGGCPGSTGVWPLIEITGGLSTVGNVAFKLVLAKALVGTNAVLIGGASTLLLDLGPVGVPLCALLVSPDVLIPATTSATGVAFAPVPIPPVPTLAGATAWFQWYVVDPGPAPLPGAMTPRLQLLVSP